jgi:hypothetical protein
MLTHSHLRSLTAVSLLVGMFLFPHPTPALAGCGCNKPSPVPAPVRPDVTYGGTPVTLFGPGLTTGQLYDITFTPMSGTTTTVSSVPAVPKRDLADAVYKAQLIVTLPPGLPLGPAGITVKRTGQAAILLSIPDTAFTVAPQPLTVASQPGSYTYQNYRAAVGRDGSVYISLDMTGVTQPRSFKAQAKGYALRFTKDDAAFFNIQGFLMQLANAPIPGLFSIAAGVSTDSDIAQYARHEFNTYFLQHAEHLPHSVDATDGNWHLDGTPHIDHDHLILVIDGTVNNATPAAGTTPAFTLQLDAYSFFQHGLVGTEAVSMSGTTLTDSYSSRTGLGGIRGDVLTDGDISLASSATINGNATATSFSLSGQSLINGTRITPTQPTSFLSVSVPIGLTDLGKIDLKSGMAQTLAPGSYKVTDLSVSGGQLVIDNGAGPVTVYVTGAVTVSSGRVTITDPDPEKFAIYVASTKTTAVKSDAAFAGVLYAPQSTVTISGSGQFQGSFVGKQMKLTGAAQVHYDTALRGE